MWNKLGNIINDNMTGILGTLAFHMFVIVVFLILKISSTRSLMESIIMVEFDETEQSIEEMIEREIPLDMEFEQYVADYLENASRNIPVNVAENLNEELSTEKYVEELLDDMDENRDEDWLKSEERLRELEQMEAGDDMIVEGEGEEDQNGPEIYRGPTNIYYSLENRYQVRLPVPVYKCEGSDIVEVKIIVDQDGKVLQAQVEEMGDSFNEICLAEAAQQAALRTRFNADNDSPVRQQGSITYHFQPQ